MSRYRLPSVTPGWGRQSRAFGLTPGVVLGVTPHGKIESNCATGICKSASAPAIVMTKAITMAKRGRSTKTDEIMELCP